MSVRGNYRVQIRHPSGIFDITNDVLELNYRKGRDAIDTLLGICKASVLRIMLKNYDDVYNPENRNSRLFGILQPFVPISVDARLGPTYPWVRLITANLDKVQGRNSSKGKKRAQITCFGIFSFLESQNAQVNVGGDIGSQNTGLILLEVLKQAFRRSELTGLKTDLWQLDEGKKRISGHYLYNKGITGGFKKTPTALYAGSLFGENREWAFV